MPIANIVQSKQVISQHESAPLNDVVKAIEQGTIALPALVERAASALTNAKTSAEVLAAHDMASVAYDVAKRAARLATIKNAHDELISAVYRSQADALVIEAQAKRRLADEYDAAQGRGEVAKSGDTLRNGPGVPERNAGKPTAADVGLSRKQIHEARAVRDAESAEPGVVQRTVDEALANREEPTKAKVRRAVKKIARRGRSKTKNVPAAIMETQHERELRVLLTFWGVSCASARAEFLTIIKASEEH